MINIDESCDHNNKTFMYLASILADVTTGDYELWLCETPKGTYYLQLRFWETCNFEGGVPSLQFCRKWILEHHMTPTEIIRTAYKAYEAAVLHEMQEKFLYKGVAIFNPHKKIEELYEECQS